MAEIKIRDGIVDRLKESRKIMSDESFARYMGSSRSTLRRVVAGEQPSGSFIASFCLAFGLGMGEAFEIVPEKKKSA